MEFFNHKPLSSGRLRRPTDTKKQSMSMCMMTRSCLPDANSQFMGCLSENLKIIIMCFIYFHIHSSFQHLTEIIYMDMMNTYCIKEKIHINIHN